MRLAKFTQKLHYNMTPEARARTYQRIMDPSKPSGSYYLRMCLSAIIATFGLLANSTAVVIGAMLVAPLMGPIFGIALSLITGESRRLKIALLAEAGGITLAVGLPVLIGLIPLRPDFGSEILARTQPTIYDVLIALASGFAGAYALINEKISPALPGVAISTALVPPLAACGLNIAAGNWILAGGAFLLFMINFIAIEFAAASMFMWFGLAGFPKVGDGSWIKAVVQRLGISFLILVLATIFMTQTLITIIKESRLDKEIREMLTKNLSVYAGARLSDVKYSQTDRGLEVRAVVITPQEFDPNRVAGLEEALHAEVSPNTQLIVSSVITKDSDRNGPVFVSSDELKLRDQVNRETNFMNEVSSVLSEQIKNLSGAQIIDVKKDTKDGIPLITASIRTTRVITPAEVLSIQQRLNDEIDSSIKLIVRSILTKDADSTHFLKGSTDLAAILQGEDLDLYKRLLSETTVYFSNDQQIAGVMVIDLSFEKTDNIVNVLTTVNTPITLDPGLVAELQNHLQTTIDSRIKVTVRSIVGGTATADSYIEDTFK